MQEPPPKVLIPQKQAVYSYNVDAPSEKAVPLINFKKGDINDSHQYYDYGDHQ